MIAMAMRGGCGLDGEDFELAFIFVLGAFAMLSQYTAKTGRGSRLALRIAPKGHLVCPNIGIAKAMP
jgi:hypothetical protein